MNVEDGMVKVKALLNGCYLVKKHHVFDNIEAKNPTIVVRMSCVNVMTDVSELTKVMRQVRQRIPKTYAVSFNIKTVV